ncbi:MAG: hypothetical protein ABW199_03450 [Caulobacterales bacterium]
MEKLDFANEAYEQFGSQNERWTELAQSKRYTPWWFAQAAGSFAAAGFIGMSLLAFVVTGGFGSADARYLPETPAASQESDLEDGQFYREQWLDPETAQPYSDEIDAQRVSFANAEPAREAPVVDTGDLSGVTDESADAQVPDTNLDGQQQTDPLDTLMQDDAKADQSPFEVS